MSNKDPHYTYTDYWPVPRTRPPKLGSVLLAAILGALVVLVIYNDALTLLGG